MATQYIPTEQGLDWSNNVSFDKVSSVSNDEYTDLVIFELLELEYPATLPQMMKNRTAFPSKFYSPIKEEVVKRSLRRLFEFGYIDQVDDDDEDSF